MSTNHFQSRFVACVLGALCLLGSSEKARADVILQTRCANDALNASAARQRNEWARTCGLAHHVGVFNTGIPATTGGTLREYVETTDITGKNAYSSPITGFQINRTFLMTQYTFGPTSQTLSGGFYKWFRSSNRLLQRPMYPTFGTNYNLAFATPIYPHPTLANCNLYFDKNGTTPINPATMSFYVNGYCTAVPSPAPGSPDPTTESRAPDADDDALGETRYVEFLNRIQAGRAIPARLLPQDP